jgi:PTH1 family peptidyl-tRNA hydrolase
MKTILIVGLGNPGKEYEKTRHNAGFLFVDYFREKYREKFSFDDWRSCKRLKSETSYGKFKKQRIVLLKPQTFMNLSGEAVAAAVKYYKLSPEDIIIVHDDIDLALGKYKISKNSSSAGHNGAQNIIDLLGTKDFTRIRIGVENRGDKKPASSADKIPTEKYVLGKFASAEMKVISKILPEISKELIKSL